MTVKARACLTDVGGVLLFLLIAHSAMADTSRSEKIILEGGVTATYQTASDSRVEADAVASVDLGVTLPTENGAWALVFEGNTTPSVNGIHGLLAEANADAGSALDANGNGRIQLSGLSYTKQQTRSFWSAGLIDPTAYLDTSEIANDENSQFLAHGLRNNATLAFPGYAIGFVWQMKPDERNPVVTVLVSGSHGLGDNPDRSYGELVDIGATGKGTFVALQTGWQVRRWMPAIGVWVRTDPHTFISGDPGTEMNYGIYANVDRRGPGMSWNLRAGLANVRVSEAAAFFAIAGETGQAPSVMGAGMAHTLRSAQATGVNRGNRTQAEIYWRYRLRESVHLTPSIQWLQHSGFDASGASFDPAVTLVGLRMDYAF